MVTHADFCIVIIERTPSWNDVLEGVFAFHLQVSSDQIANSTRVVPKTMIATKGNFVRNNIK